VRGWGASMPSSSLTRTAVISSFAPGVDLAVGNRHPAWNGTVVCPTTTIDAIVGPGGKNELVPTRWGLVAVVVVKAADGPFCRAFRTQVGHCVRSEKIFSCLLRWSRSGKI
jgi:hypothetical protein